jgi:hypothetical protein
MPATAAAIDSARSAAEHYALAIAAERKLLDHLPAPGHPDRPMVLATLAVIGQVSRRAYARYRRVVLDLLKAGDVDQATRLMTHVRDRSRVARMPVAITISEDRP